jgi:hypothetical protein
VEVAVKIKIREAMRLLVEPSLFLFFFAGWLAVSGVGAYLWARAFEIVVGILF